MIPNNGNWFSGKAMRGKILSAMINLIGTFSMIRLAAAAMLNETPDAELRFRCSRCRRRSGFAISLRDERHRSDNTKNDIERVIVPGR